MPKKSKKSKSRRHHRESDNYNGSEESAGLIEPDFDFEEFAELNDIQKIKDIDVLLDM